METMFIIEITISSPADLSFNFFYINFSPVLSDFLKPRKANRRIMVFEIYDNSFINLSSLRDF